MAHEVTDLNQLADDLQQQAATSHAQRAAHTLLGRGSQLRQTVIALDEGAELAEHENPGYASLQVLRGEVRLTGGEESWDLPAGALTRIPDARHSVTALSDAVFLLSTALTMAG